MRIAKYIAGGLVILPLLLNNAAVLAADPYTAWNDQGIVYTAPVGDAYYPCVIYDANKFGETYPYKMWYSNGTDAFITKSLDGLSWVAPISLTGLGSSVHHVQVLYDVNSFGQGASGPRYRMWYWNINSNLYDISSIYTAQSIDGISWANSSPLSQDPLAELVTGADTGWNRGSYGPVCLFYHPIAPNTGTDPFSYTYTMYYDGTDGSTESTGLAYSANGSFWNAYPSNPVLTFSSVPAWDSNDAVYGSVYKDFNGFHYWYSGGISSPDDGIGYAYSVDGKNWAKNPTPIFTINDGKAYRNERTYTASVINDQSGILKMYYTAKAINGPKKIGIAYMDLPVEPTPTPTPTITPTITPTVTPVNVGGEVEQANISIIPWIILYTIFICGAILLVLRRGKDLNRSKSESKK